MSLQINLIVGWIKTNMNIIDQLKEDEGFSQYPYVCTAGKLTIGYGANIDPDKSGPGIPQHIAELLLEYHLETTRKRLLERVPGLMLSLNKDRTDALVMMAYQLGVNGALNFKKMIKALRAGDWQRAASEALDSLWAKQTPKRAELASYIFQHGSYPK